MKIELIRKISRCGGKYVIVIPRDLIEKGVLKPSQLYVVKLEEAVGNA